MTHAVRPAVVLAVLFLTSTICMADVITSDPNVPGAQVEVKAPEKIEIDSRLDQKITYKAEVKRLPEVLAELSSQTGVQMTVSSGSRFWHVRQRRVTLFIKDMPLRQLMDQLERLLDYHFSRMGEPGAYSYVLWQDLNGRKSEQGTLTSREEQKRLHQMRAITDTLKDAEMALMIKPEDAEKYRKKNPWLAYLAGNPRGRAYAELMLSIPREALDKLVAEDQARVMFNLEDLSPHGQEALRKIGSLIDFKKISEEVYSGGLGDDASVDGFWISRNNDETTQDLAVPYWLQVGVERHTVDAFSITYSDAPMDKVTSYPAGWNQEEQRAREVLYIEQEREKQKDEKPDPVLEQTAKYEEKKPVIGQSSTSFTLEQLAELFDFDVMYECYPIRSTGYSTYIGERSLKATLQDIVQYTGDLDWTIDNTVIRFRHSDWALRRSWEIPEEWINAWTAVIERDHWLDLDTLVEIATKVSEDQFKHNFQSNGWIPSSTIEDPLVVDLFRAAGVGKARYAREMLSMYGRLSTLQREKIWSPEGLSFDEIADEPMFRGGTQTINGTPLYDITLNLSKGPAPEDSPEATGEVVYFAIRMKMWKRDISPADIQRMNEHRDANVTVVDNGETLELTQKAVFIAANRERVKAVLEQIKKAQEEKLKQQREEQTQK